MENHFRNTPNELYRRSAYEIVAFPPITFILNKLYSLFQELNLKRISSFSLSQKKIILEI